MLYKFVYCGYDPAAGGSFMAQRMRTQYGIPMSEVSFSSSVVQTRMATSFVQIVKARKLLCFEDPEGRLRRDFGKFSIEHKPPSNYKLIAVSDESGHADAGISLVIFLPKAIELLGGFIGLLPDDDLTDLNDDDLSEEEYEALPDEFKEMDEMLIDEKDEYRIKKELGWGGG